MPTAAASTKVTIGLLEFDAKLFRARESTGVSLRSLCEKGHPVKQQLVCPVDNTVFQSYKEVPKRGFELGEDVFLEMTAEEAKRAAKSSEAEKFETLTMERVVDIKQLWMHHAVEESFYLLPDEGASKTTLKLYRILVEGLGAENRAVLTRFTLRDKPERFALVADPDRNLIMAYQLGDLRPVPYEVETAKVAEKERMQVKTLLDAEYKEDAWLQAEPDPLLKYIEKKLRSEGDEKTAKKVEKAAAPPPNPEVPA